MDEFYYGGKNGGSMKKAFNSNNVRTVVYPRDPGIYTDFRREIPTVFLFSFKLSNTIS
jgi:hypothetical protein